MALTQVNAGDRINASDLNAYYNILKGVAASGESITLIYNAAGVIILQPSSDPAAGTELIQIKNNAGTVQSALSSDGRFYAADGLVGTPGIAFEGDKDTGFFRTGANDMSLVTGGTDRIRVNTSGEVGIGTAPGSTIKLKVAGTIQTTGTIAILNSLADANVTMTNSGGSGAAIFAVSAANGMTVDGLITASNGVTLGSTKDITMAPTSQVNGRLILFGGGGTPEYLSADGGNNGLIGIIARESVFVQIDSDNTGTAGVFAIGHNSTTYDANEIFRVDESGNVTAGVAAGAKLLAAGTLTAGGLLTSAVQVGTSGPLIYSGSGAPSISAAVKGSLYLRSDGTTTNDRAYIATNTSGTWTALTTAA